MITAAHLNEVVRTENADRAAYGIQPLPTFGLPAGTLPDCCESTVVRTYRYRQGDIELTVHRNGCVSVYYAPIGDTIEFLPKHRQHAFDYAGGKRAHLAAIDAGGDYARRAYA